MGRKERRKEGREEGEEKEGKEEGRKGGRKGGSGREGRKGGRKEGRQEGEVQIACGELRWEGARARWTETKPWKSLAESFEGKERDSILDVGGSETACWTDRKPCK